VRHLHGQRRLQRLLRSVQLVEAVGQQRARDVPLLHVLTLTQLHRALPVATINALVDGGHLVVLDGHALYWVSEGVREWVRRDQIVSVSERKRNQQSATNFFIAKYTTR
jgi:hypothetical protein